MKKIKCGVCGARFYPKHQYEVKEFQGALAAVTSLQKMYDAMDCPHCGCQKILCERIPNVETVIGGEEE